MDVYRARLDEGVTSPYEIEQPFAAIDAQRMLDKETQEFKLAQGEIVLDAVDEDFISAEVDT